MDPLERGEGGRGAGACGRAVGPEANRNVAGTGQFVCVLGVVVVVADPDSAFIIDGEIAGSIHARRILQPGGAIGAHRAVEQRLGKPLSIHRWRGNIWLDCEAPWEEFDWMDRDVQIGECILTVRERTDRCMATAANPKTGKRDADTLGALEHWGHQDFSVRAEVKQGGLIRKGDTLVVL